MTATYNRVVYAFNHDSMKVTGCVGELYILSSDGKVSEHRTPDASGTVEFDLFPYIANAFYALNPEGSENRVEAFNSDDWARNWCRGVEELTLDDDNNTQTVKIFWCWGSKGATESPSPERWLKVFTYFPQTIDILFGEEFDTASLPNVTVTLQDGTVATDTLPPDPTDGEPSIYGWTYTRYKCPGLPLKTIVVDGVISEPDLSLTNPLPQIFHFEVDDCQEGVFLRWLDHMGVTRYMRFDVYAEGRTTKVSELYQRPDFGIDFDVEGDELWQRGAGASTEVATARTQTLYLPHVDANYYRELLTLATSSAVDMFLGWEGVNEMWQRVGIQGGTFSRKEKDRLNDFAVTIVIPTTQAQVR